MLPMLTFNDQMNGAVVYPVESSDFCLRHPIFMGQPNPRYLILGENVHPVLRAMAMPLLLHGIVNVILVGSWKDVRPMETGRGVAPVKDALSSGEFPKEELERKPWDSYLSSAWIRKYSITTRIMAPVPKRTLEIFPWLRSIYWWKFRKPNLQVFKIANLVSHRCGLLTSRSLPKPHLFKQGGFFNFTIGMSLRDEALLKGRI